MAASSVTAIQHVTVHAKDQTHVTAMIVEPILSGTTATVSAMMDTTVMTVAFPITTEPNSTTPAHATLHATVPVMALSHMTVMRAAITLTSIIGEYASATMASLVSTVRPLMRMTTTRETATTPVTVVATDQTRTTATVVLITPTWTAMDTVTV